jgi:hypothetical protein
MCRRIALFALLLFVILCVGAGLVVYNVTRSGPGGPAQAEAAPPSPQEELAAEKTLERLREQVEGRAPSPERGNRNGDRKRQPPRTVELRMTDGDVNRMLRALPEVRATLDRQKIAAPRIQFKPGRLVASARVPVVGKLTARVSATGRIWADGGALSYETEDVRIGDFPAPAPVRELLDRELAAGIRQINGQVAGHVDEILLSEGELLVRATR